jgi:hypothetical protein
MQTMALPSTMTWASKPLAEDILLLDAAKKDSTGTRLWLQPLFKPLTPMGY